jgi:iron(III) transport system permease protein
MSKVKPEMRIIYIPILLLFAIFLLLPLCILFIRSIETDNGFSFANYASILSNQDLIESIGNSIKISSVTAVIATILAFILAYSIHCTRIYRPIKGAIKTGILIPMLLPTITYGFAIMYSFGNQGLITKIVGRNLFEIYGFNGLLIGYVIYTLPAAFLLINNSFKYIDKKFIIVSKLMGDSTVRSFMNTIIRPLLGTLGGAFVLSFILSFTDFGIPASVGGTYNVVATHLYQVMLGSIPDFNNGAVIAVLMLLPAVFAVFLLSYLERFNFHYDKFSDTELIQHKLRDTFLGIISSVILLGMFSVFVVMFIAPFLTSYPYDLTFTFKHFIDVFQSSDLLTVYKNSLFVAAVTAVFGTLIAFCSAILNVRTPLKGKATIDIVSMITNTVPGMVLGLSYLLLFNGSSLKGTFIIIILCNIVHFFTTPYLMAKNSLSKMNPSWETTGELLGDSWIKTVYRVILPNSASTVIEMFSYYFINAMVTISGIIFLVSAQTSLVASKIKELQHFAKFNEIFVLSLLIFVTNLVVKLLCDYFQRKTTINKPPKINDTKRGKFMIKNMNKIMLSLFALSLIVVLVACNIQKEDEVKTVVIQTNGDEEAITAMETALKEAGYEGKYTLQSLGTSELGGKLMAEGKQMEADLVTMSSYFIESAQQKHSMFKDLAFETNALEQSPSYYTPILAITGSIFINTEVIKEKGLTTPTSIKDLTKPEFKGLVSIPNILDSSTGWLLIQAVISQYGEEEGKAVLHDLIANSGPHLESSGSGPIKKVQAGEVAAGFGLRHQAVAAKEAGAPIDFIDPIEGNFSLTESIAVVNKDDETTKLAMEMAEAIVKNARKDLVTNYPVALYQGETVSSINQPAHAKKFDQPLTVELLEQHQQFFNSAK